MKTTLIYVSTLNAKITKGNDPNVSNWTSKEDQKYFKEIQERSEVIVRSSVTYEIAKPRLKLRKGQLIIVLTRDPSKYTNDTIKGQLEFTNESPKKLISRLKNNGIKNILLSIGGKLATVFLKDKLVDQFIITFEPKIFGSGISFIVESNLDLNLKLVDHKILNETGTILLTYSVQS